MVLSICTRFAKSRSRLPSEIARTDEQVGRANFPNSIAASDANSNRRVRADDEPHSVATPAQSRFVCFQQYLEGDSH